MIYFVVVMLLSMHLKCKYSSGIVSFLDTLSLKCQCDFQVEIPKGQNKGNKSIEVWKEVGLKV